MGITLYAKNSNLEVRFGYLGFYHLRTNIAFALDREFGEHYRNIIDTLHATESEEAEYWDKYEEIISRKKLHKNKAILNFLLASDCNGKRSCGTCKKIYDLIKNTDLSSVGFDADDRLKERYENFKKLLLECWQNKRYLMWN